MTKAERLKQLIEAKNPNNALAKILEHVEIAKGDKGDPGPQGIDGYTPVKGKDYYTEEEITLMVDFIQSRVRNGVDGVPGLPGKDGVTPERGVDYWTSKDQEKILKDVLAKVPKPKDGVSPNVDDIIKKVQDGLPPVNYKEEIGKILNTPGFRMLLHGGGLSSVAHDDTLTGDGTVGNPLSVVSSSGLVLETNGTPNGSQTLLNLVEGTNMTITDDGLGNITFDSTGSGGSSIFVNGDEVIDPDFIDTDTLTYTVGGSTVEANVRTQMSITSDASGLMLENDDATPGNSKYYGTDSGGTKGFFTITSATPGGTDRQLQFNDAGSFGGSLIEYNTIGDTGQLTVPTDKNISLMADGTGNVSLVFGGDMSMVLDATAFSFTNNVDNFYSFFGDGAFGILDFSGIDSSSKTFTFPNQSGTVALTSDLATYVPTSRTLTINGSTQDLSADRTWTITTTGTANRISVSGGSGLTPTIDISATYVGQASITTLGTITTGVWNGTDVGLGAGGTGASLSDPGFDAVFVWDNTTNATRLAQLSGLSYDSGTNTLTASGSGVDFGTDAQIPYMNATNDNFEYTAGFEFDGTNLAVPGDVTVGDDLLLTSSGSVINFNGGDVTITHSSNDLAIAGGSLTVNNQVTATDFLVSSGGSATDPSFRTTGDPELGIYFTGTTLVGFAAGGGSLGTFNTSGFQIGTAGARVTQFDNDGTLATNSAVRSVTQQAVKTYVDTLLLDYVPESRTITVNGNTQDLTTDRTYTITTTGTANRISVSGGAGTTPTIDISATYVGQASITTLGTITTGVWNATDVALGAGGTGASLSDPGFDAVFVWDNTTNATRLAQLDGLTYDSGTNTLTASSGSGTVTEVTSTDNSVSITDPTTTPDLSVVAITVADAGGDTTTFVGLWTDATGVLAPKTDTGLTYNATTNALTTTTFIGALTGTASVATTVTVADETTDASSFINFTTAATGNLGIKTNSNMTFDSSTGIATFASTVLTTTDINGGTIDGTVIGGSSAAAITGTNITANTNFLPDTDGGAGLGTATQAFANLFLDTGATINFDNGNSVITHSSGILTVSTGDLRVTTAGTNGASVVTVAGTQTLTNKSLTSPLITNLTSGRVTFAGASGLLTDDADFTFATDTLTVTKIAATTFTGNITTSAVNIVTDTTTGTKIGTATNQKLGFFNATPIVQPTGDVITALQNLGLGASLTITATVASTVTVANEATDTTCFPLFVTAATGDLGPKSNAGLTFNSNTSLLASTLLQGGKVGVGVAPDAARLLLVSGDVSGGVATINRTNAATNAPVGSMIIKATSSGDMADNFGPVLQFGIQDTANVENLIANITAVRSGADNSGALIFNTASAGSLAPAMQIFDDQIVLISEPLQIGESGGTTGAIDLVGTTSGIVRLQVADAAGTYTLTLPTDDGTSGQQLTTDGNGILSWASAGGVPTTITVANEATDTTCFPLFVTAATGDLGPKSNANLTYNSNTSLLFSTLLQGTNIGVGGAPTSTTGLIVSGTGYTSNLIAATGSVSPGANTNGTVYRIAATIVEAGSGTHNLLSTMFLGQTTVTAGAATVSNTASLYIEDAMAATVSGVNYAIWSDAGVNRLDGSTIFGTTISPQANDGAALGSTSLSFSDLFLASGAVINIANSDWVATHTTGILTVGTGDLRVTNAGTNAASVLTQASTNTVTNKTMTGATNTLTASLLKSATTEVSVSAATAPSAGQVLTATNSTTATWQTPSVANMAWTEVTGTSQSAAVNNGYIANNGSLVTITLPSSAAVGSIVRVIGQGAGGWRIAQNASQQIIWKEGGVDGSDETTVGTGGRLDSTDDGDAVELICTVTNNTWRVLSAHGNIGLT